MKRFWQRRFSVRAYADELPVLVLRYADLFDHNELMGALVECLKKRYAVVYDITSERVDISACT